MKQQNHPVILVKKRKKHAAHAPHLGTWKLAYADFMTAMMAFFLVMWLLAISTPKDRTQIAEYFSAPLFSTAQHGEKISLDSSVIPGGGNDPTRNSGIEDQRVKGNRQAKGTEGKQLEELRERLQSAVETDPRLKAMQHQLQIDLVSEGLRIQIIDSQNRPMFKLGSALVEPYMRDILRAIAPILNELPNKISLSGHTDDIPYVNGSKGGYSNWELSADRANASRRELTSSGLDITKILRVVGMASTMNLQGRSADDPANRRISLIVLNKEAQENIERENRQSGAQNVKGVEDLKNQAPSFANPPASVLPDGSPATKAVPPNGSKTSTSSTPVEARPVEVSPPPLTMKAPALKAVTSLPAAPDATPTNSAQTRPLEPTINSTR